MGKIRYTVTTKTTRCPYCGRILNEDIEGQLAPLIACLWFITLPVLIPYWVIKHWGLGDPVMPKVGPKTMKCPQCFRDVRTGNLAVEDLQEEELVTYRFRTWFYVSYAFGAMLSFTLLILLLDGESLVSAGGMLALFAFLIVLVITLSYRIQIANCKTPEQEDVVNPNNPTTEQNNNDSRETNDFFYCRKCGNKLPADSQFCNKCGTATIR
jgi:hypothetical protein